MQLSQEMTLQTSPNFNQIQRYLNQFLLEMFDSLQQDFTSCVPQYKLNIFFPKAS